MFDEFLKNFRKMLGGPTSVVGGATKEATKQEKTPQKVWGFEEDKTNYSDGKKISVWRDVTARNNDTGKEFKFSVGYDQDGKIAGAKTKIDDTTSKGYIGKDSVSNFFKSNFDRDATDYTIYDDVNYNDGNKYVVFDSKADGAFIPSLALGMDRRSTGVPVDASPNVDSPYESASDFITKFRLRDNTEANERYSQEDESKAEPAFNGTLDVKDMHSMPRTMQELDFFSQNAGDFVGMAMEFSRTPDAKARMQILKNAYEKYGSLPKFNKYLEIMAADEDAYKRGEYKDYDYRRVGHDIADAVNDVYKHYYHSV